MASFSSARYSGHVGFVLAVICVIATYAAMNHLLVNEIAKYLSHGLPIHGFKRLAMLLVGAALFTGVTLFSATPIFFVVLVISLGNFFVNQTYTTIAKDVINEEVAFWLFSEIGSLSDALAQFPNEFGISSLWTLVLGIFFIAVRNLFYRYRLNRTSLSPRKLSFVSLGLMCAFTVVIARTQPDPMPWESNMAIHLSSYAMTKTPPRNAVELSSTPSSVRNIVVIVDESVRADTFRRLFGDQMLKLGAVELRDTWSSTPCSGGSNAFLRWGINPRISYDETNDPRAQPGLFAYARKAGYHSTFIDAQSKGGVQNFMNTDEKALIDTFVPASDGIDSDHRMAVRVNKLLRNGERNLVFMVKRGAHFPYSKNLPAESASTISTEREKYAAAVVYANTGFFESLTEGVDRSSSLIIYTSDHAQNFQPGYQPHCNPKPLADELIVPLWVIGNMRSDRHIDDSKNSDEQSTRIFSSLQIFPTVLAAMGFDAARIERDYFMTLERPIETAWLLRSPYIPFSARKSGAVVFYDARQMRH